MPEDEDIVLLVHRTGQRDAAHARLSTLDEDARLWVRRQLADAATEETADTPLRPLPVPAATTSQLHAGREALEAYDYPHAQRCFEAAVEDQPGSVQAALALLELLVEHLAMDTEALAVAEQLREPASSAPELRCLLATAAARSGHLDRAEALLQDQRGPRVGGALLRLASRALALDELARARTALLRLAELDPANAERLRLERRLAEKLAARHGADQDRISRLLDEGALDAAEDETRALLSSWPDSSFGRSALARIAEGRRRQAISALLAGAESTSSPRKALELLRAARDQGAKDLAPRIQDLSRRVRAEEDRAAAEALLDQLAEDPRAGLYAAAEQSQAVRTLAAQAEPRLHQLEALLQTARRGRDAVAALLACEQALAIEQDRPTRARELLEDHRELLRALPEAREAYGRLRARLRRQRQERFERNCREAEALLQDGLADTALAMLEALELDGLGPEERERVRLMRESAETRLRAAERRRRWQDLAAAEHWLAARDHARSCAEATGSAEWERRSVQAEDELRRAWHIEILDGSAAWTDLRDHRLTHAPLMPSYWLRPGGRELLLCTTWERELVIRRIAVHDGRILQVVLLRTPEALGVPTWACTADRVWFFGTCGVLCLDVDGWTPRAWWPEGSPAQERSTAADFLAPGGRYLWLDGPVGPDPRRGTCRVVDGDTGRTVRSLTDCWSLAPVPGEPPVVLRTGPDGAISFLTPRGSSHRHWTLSADWRGAILPDPGGQGVLMLCATKLVQAREGGGTHLGTGVAQLMPWRWGGDAHLPALRLAGTIYSEDSTCGATSRELALSFVVASDGARGCWLIAIERRGELTQERWRVQIPRAAQLAQDAEARRVCLVCMSVQGAHVWPLGADPPEIPAALLASFGSVPHLHPPFTVLADEALQERLEAWSSDRRPVPEDDSALEAWLDEARQTVGQDPEGLVALVVSLMTSGRLYEGRQELERGLALRPEDPRLGLLATLVAAELENWQAVVDRTTPSPVPSLPAGLACHDRFLRGLAQLHCGDAAAAAETWQQGVELEGMRALDLQVAYARAVLGQPTDDFGGPTTIGQVRCLVAADSSLARGRPHEALQVLDAEPTSWLTVELQTAARRAAAWLLLPASSAQERYRKRVALAALVALIGDRDESLVDLPLGGKEWKDARLEALEVRARAWLDGSEPEEVG